MQMIRKELRNTLESYLLAAFVEDYSIRIIDHCTSVGVVLSSLYGRQRIMIILFCFFIAPGDF